MGGLLGWGGLVLSSIGHQPVALDAAKRKKKKRREAHHMNAAVHQQSPPCSLSLPACQDIKKEGKGHRQTQHHPQTAPSPFLHPRH